MRTLPEGMAEALAGSTGAEARIQFNLWYDGKLVEPNVPVSSWGLDWDISRQVQCQAKATVLDEDGTLTPWDLEDPLGAGGGILQTQIVVANTSASIAWQTITSAEPDETWRTIGGKTVWIPGGASIPIEADDRTEGVIAARFMAPQQPQNTNSIIAEIRHLLTGLMDVRVDVGITDGTVPSTIVYKEDRMAAVEDLVDALGAGWRVTGDGQFQIYDRNASASIWTTKGGSEGELIRVKRKFKIDGNHNAFVSRNTAPDGRELQGVAKIETGPERFAGPLGQRIRFHAASFATTQVQIEQTARTLRDNRMKTATVVLPVRTVLNPAIELGDWITVMMPLPDGTEAPLTGKVLTISWSGSDLLPVGMDLQLECPAADVRAASQKVRASRWQAR